MVCTLHVSTGGVKDLQSLVTRSLFSVCSQCLRYAHSSARNMFVSSESSDVLLHFITPELQKAIDFNKAFDSFQHEATWNSLRNHSISEQYICFLTKQNTDQRATVLTDVESDEFSIARGTKQGDLLSSLLFNSVLQSAMEKDIGIWKDEGLGIKLSDEKKTVFQTWASQTTCS